VRDLVGDLIDGSVSVGGNDGQVVPVRLAAYLVVPVGLEYTILCLTCRLRCAIRLCGEVVLVNEPVEDWVSGACYFEGT
jgi:hypothetical protein